jgi:excisionase family DNA binding protein
MLLRGACTVRLVSTRDENGDPTPTPDDMLTRTEASNASGFSVATIDRRIADGTLPYFRLRNGRAIRIRRRDLDLLWSRVDPGTAA